MSAALHSRGLWRLPRAFSARAASAVASCAAAAALIGPARPARPPPQARPTAHPAANPPMPHSRESARTRPRLPRQAGPATRPCLPRETGPQVRSAVGGEAARHQPARTGPEGSAVGLSRGIQRLCSLHRSSTAGRCTRDGRCTSKCHWTCGAAARERTIDSPARGRGSADRSAEYESTGARSVSKCQQVRA